MKKLFIALAVGVAVFTAAYASAATLGVLTSDDLGSADAAVASCDSNGVISSYQTSYDSTKATYVVDTVTVSGIDATACANQTIKVTLTDNSNADIGAGTDTVDAASVVVTIVGDTVAEDVLGVHIVITGP